jgi:hypothetical protein
MVSSVHSEEKGISDPNVIALNPVIYNFLNFIFIKLQLLFYF